MTVTNLNNGCTASDEVVMMEDIRSSEVTLATSTARSTVRCVRSP